ncbi:MAG: type II toxin-antitoxin system HicB family antitoxin [Aurantimonas endophytica]|jgi:antitoxin HicB|uniref:Antitoxin HicB n=1 Tax=Aurantimonas endophytica TaxID=1522175 RepID=A0A7W6HFP6_9HYPH|nr:type II toxin-antitoxin system HicB family antitoxin [Aurantimonas endophytica]MBB4004093.1 antitoxin HicB [Aurantimonas endophytica]MCO6404938.1 type II toxin-antitoxin system HicB family antitoxin [Aurantimonas endophytica]
MRLIYPARLEADPDGGFVVTFPDVPEAISGGATRESAIGAASEVLGIALRWALRDGRDLPAASETIGDLAIPVGASDAMKLAVCEAFQQSGISQAELARRLGKDEKLVRRILDPDHATKLAMLEATLAVLGRRVVIETIAA